MCLEDDQGIRASTKVWLALGVSYGADQFRQIVLLPQGKFETFLAAKTDERHAAGTARVVPIIVEECDWKAMRELRQLKAVPTDGKAISAWANPNTAYLNVVQELRRIIEAEAVPAAAAKVADEPSATHPSMARYRAKRQFDHIDKGDFRDAAFATFKDYFRRAIIEIDSIDGFRGRFVDRSATSFGATVVNSGHRNGTAHISVHCRSSQVALGDRTRRNRHLLAVRRNES